MPGVKGRSGGHNKKPISELKLTGTYQPSKHDGILVAPADQVKLLPEPYLVSPDFEVDKAQIFHKFAEYLYGAGMTAAEDDVILGQLVQLYEVYLQSVKRYNAEGLDAKIGGQKLAFSVMQETAKEIRILMAEFRLTPSTRQNRMKDVTQDVPADPVADFLQKN